MEFSGFNHPLAPKTAEDRVFKPTCWISAGSGHKSPLPSPFYHVLRQTKALLSPISHVWRTFSHVLCSGSHVRRPKSHVLCPGSHVLRETKALMQLISHVRKVTKALMFPVSPVRRDGTPVRNGGPPLKGGGWQARLASANRKAGPARHSATSSPRCWRSADHRRQD